MSTDIKPSPSQLWHQANHECQGPGATERRRARYMELMREHGHVIARTPEDDTRVRGCDPQLVDALHFEIGDLVQVPRKWLDDDEEPWAIVPDPLNAGADIVLIAVRGVRPYKLHGILEFRAIQHDTGELHLSSRDRLMVRRGIATA